LLQAVDGGDIATFALVVGIEVAVKRVGTGNMMVSPESSKLPP
jgi:hypothetical protein